MKYFVLVIALCTSTSAMAFGSDSKWTSGWGMGVSEAIITQGPGNQIYVTCDDGAGRNATGISFMLGGDSSKGSSIQLTFDKGDPEDYSLWSGEVPSQCHACASTYDAIIQKFKAHSSVHVKFTNGLAAKFTLSGASKAIGKCVADFYR